MALLVLCECVRELVVNKLRNEEGSNNDDETKT